MKKSILIIIAIIGVSGLMAFNFINWNADNTVQQEPKKELASQNETVVFVDDFLSKAFPDSEIDLFYDIDSRFIHTITKEKLTSAKSVRDLVPTNAAYWNYELHNVRVTTMLKGADDQIKIGNDAKLTTEQIDLLHGVAYSENIHVNATKIDPGGSEKSEYDQLAYYMTIVPETQASFVEGKKALLQYLRKNSRKETAIIKKENLKACRINFTVTKEGRISNVRLDSTSGYSSVDNSLIKLIQNMPEKWQPAMDAEGNVIDQELIFFFGIAGC